jgi:hypothetical protein
MKWPCSGPNAPSALPSTSNRRSSACRTLTAYCGGWRRCACLDAKTRVWVVGALASTTCNNFIADLLFLSEVSHSLLVAGAPCVLRTPLFGEIGPGAMSHGPRAWCVVRGARVTACGCGYGCGPLAARGQQACRSHSPLKKVGVNAINANWQLPAQHALSDYRGPRAWCLALLALLAPSPAGMPAV